MVTESGVIKITDYVRGIVYENNSRKFMSIEGPIERKDDYYPFGLTFNSSERCGYLTNNYLYNGKELQDELGLGWMDYGARMNIPAISEVVVDPYKDMINLDKISNYIFFITLFIFLVACANHDKQYFYAHYYKGDSIPNEYQIFKISYHDGFRIDSIFYSKTIDGIYEFDRIRKYLVRDGKLYRVNLKDTKKLTPYMSTLDTECVESPGIKLQETEVITVCFLGQENIVIDGKEFKNAYKFKRTFGFDGITTIDYYDSDLILLKEEHIYGYTAPFYKMRIEKK